MARIAVVQPGLALGEVDATLVRLEGFIRSIPTEHSAQVIVVPEAGTTPDMFSKAHLDCVLALEGKAIRVLTGPARELALRHHDPVRCQARRARLRLRRSSGSSPCQDLPDTDRPDEIPAATAARTAVATAR